MLNRKFIAEQRTTGVEKSLKGAKNHKMQRNTDPVQLKKEKKIFRVNVWLSSQTLKLT